MAETPASPAPAPSSGEPATPPASPEPPAPAFIPSPAALEATPVTPALEALDAVELGEPRVATTLEVPPLPASPRPSFIKPASTAGAGATDPGIPGAEGGEWDLLMGKVRAWLEQNDLPGQWERLGGPLRGFGVLLGFLLVLKLYVALLDTLDDVLLLPRLLQLVGLIAVLRFSVLRLTRSSDRQEVLDDWKRRWDAFRGA
jgi:hypothetical protein